MGALTLRYLAVVLAIVACKDLAEPDYAKCVQLSIEDKLSEAWEACGDAVKVSPNSESGKAAQVKLAELKPKYDAWKAADDARQAELAEVKRRALEMAKANRINDLRKKITVEWFELEKDSVCTGKGAPPYKWSYKGGTYRENDELAKADGCTLRYDLQGQNTEFCCPARPGFGDDR